MVMFCGTQFLSVNVNLAVIFTLMPLCMTAGFGESCDDSNPCTGYLVCSSTTNKCQCVSGFTYVQNKCLDTPYGRACTRDEDCPSRYGVKCLDKQGKQDGPLLCSAVPGGLKEVHVDQILDESGKLYMNVSWVPGPYTGPISYAVVVEGRDYFSTVYNVGSAILTDYGVSSVKVKSYMYGGWIYRASVTPQTPAGKGPKYQIRDFVALDRKPGLVQDVKVIQDSYFAREISLTFGCPDSITRNGNITAFIIRKTLTSNGINSSTEHTIPHNFVSSKCAISVSASQLGGIEVPNNYTFEVKIKNAKFEGNFSSPVELFAGERKPYASTTALLEELISPYTNDTSKVVTTFDVQLCSSCFVDPVQGPVTSAALLICVEPENELCYSSLRLFNSSRSKDIDRPQDINLYGTWAMAKAHNFTRPYRTTPDGWHKMLLRDNSKSFIYRIGGDLNCNEKDLTVFCNGPLPSERRFAMSVVVCNNAGCDITTQGHNLDDFHTKAGDESENDRNDVNLGLAIALGVALFICFALFIYLVFTRLRRSPTYL